MALRKNFETEGSVEIKTPHGVIVQGNQRVIFSAYVKVTTVNGNKKNITANVVFQCETHEFYKQYDIPVSVNSGAANFIEQAYNHLKTLPEFSGAVDC